jgi:transposase
MKFIHNRQELEHTLILMHHDGRSIRELSRQFHLGRNTVRRILRAHAQRRDSGHDLLIPLRAGLKRASKLDAFDPEIKKLLEKYPDITGLRIYEELKEMGYAGVGSAF